MKFPVVMVAPMFTFVILAPVGLGRPVVEGQMMVLLELGERETEGGLEGLAQINLRLATFEITMDPVGIVVEEVYQTAVLLVAVIWLWASVAKT